jgi:hypothetical protein
VLAPDITEAARLGLDARLLNEAAAHDPADLAEWADGVPDAQYLEALRIIAYLVLDDGAFADHDA